jgi:uncharacterized membrane protein
MGIVSLQAWKRVFSGFFVVGRAFPKSGISGVMRMLFGTFGMMFFVISGIFQALSMVMFRIFVVVMAVFHGPQGNSRKEGDHPEIFSGSSCPEKIQFQRKSEVEKAGCPGQLPKLSRQGRVGVGIPPGRKKSLYRYGLAPDTFCQKLDRRNGNHQAERFCTGPGFRRKGEKGKEGGSPKKKRVFSFHCVDTS